MPDSIVSEKGDVWIYRYRHQTQPDSMAYFVYCPTTIGKKINGFTIPAETKMSLATEVTFDDQSVNGKMKSLKIVNGRLVVDFSEVPKFILLSRK